MTPQRTKLIDVFMVFLMVVGALQFVYCVIAGNYVCALDGGLEEGIVLTKVVAIQRFLVWILGDGGTVCFDWYICQLRMREGMSS